MADLTGLDPQFAQQIQAMVNASGGRLYIESGYRSDAQQAALYADAVRKYGEANAGQWVAPPGQSNHNRGLAVDLGGDIDLAHRLAPQFGLVFPMSWEPWHIEPVHARETSSQQAYTNGPPGTMNPTQDQSLSQTPQFMAAQLSNSLQSLGQNPVAGVANATTENAGTQQQQQPQGSSQGGLGISGGQVLSGATKGNVDPKVLYQKLLAAGMDPLHAAGFVAVAGRESGYNTGAFNGNQSTGDESYGLFQINKLGGQHAQYSSDSLLTLEGSVNAAADMYRSGGVRPWGPYKGDSWLYNTQPYWQTAIDASGGQVTMDQMQQLAKEGL